jgi:DNA-binding NarL/FixJ family response regulator
LKALLEASDFTVVGEAANGLEAIKLVEQLRPRLVIMDFTMPEMNGIDAAREITQRVPGTRVMLMTMHNEDEYVFTALRSGVSGYFLKTQSTAELIAAVRELDRGNTYLSPSVSHHLVQSMLSGTPPVSARLSSRERQVLQLIAEGKTTKEIAAILGMSVRTGESHRANIMDKLGVRDTAGLVRYAIRLGLIQP